VDDSKNLFKNESVKKKQKLNQRSQNQISEKKEPVKNFV